MQQGDPNEAKSITSQISKEGGLESYQLASQTGQLGARGGDTSKLLKAWLSELRVLPFSSDKPPIKLLEIGCLSPDNTISQCNGVQMERIDLHSTHPSILEQDFMQRPLPSTADEEFDVISLSLVLNFVPTPAERGQMLLRTAEFLRRDEPQNHEVTYLPALFLTLPLPCISNSRYLTSSLVADILSSLGYSLIKSKETSKLYYSLWHFKASETNPSIFKKKELVSGKARNNFCITLNPTY